MSVTRLQNEASQSIRDRVQSIIHYLRSEIRLLVIPPVTGEIPKCERVRLVRSSRSAVHPFAPELQKPRRSEAARKFVHCVPVQITGPDCKRSETTTKIPAHKIPNEFCKSFNPFVRSVRSLCQ
jgi:hypothetical protein